MARNRLLPSRRREDIRAWWAEHLAAQRKSGQTQAAYCRAQGLDPKHFSLWKGKLQATVVASAPRMVPVVVAPTAEPPASAMPETASASPCGVEARPARIRIYCNVGSPSRGVKGTLRSMSGFSGRRGSPARLSGTREAPGTSWTESFEQKINKCPDSRGQMLVAQVNSIQTEGGCLQILQESQ
jgi:hypothetical protein